MADKLVLTLIFEPGSDVHLANLTEIPDNATRERNQTVIFVVREYSPRRKDQVRFRGSAMEHKPTGKPGKPCGQGKPRQSQQAQQGISSQVSEVVTGADARRMIAETNNPPAPT